eukprot:2536462-Amphidinium_carterae.1
MSNCSHTSWTAQHHKAGNAALCCELIHRICTRNKGRMAFCACSDYLRSLLWLVRDCVKCNVCTFGEWGASKRGLSPGFLGFLDREDSVSPGK